MDRSTLLLRILLALAVSFGLTTLVLAGPTPTPAIPPTQCSLDNPTATIVTDGRQHNNQTINKLITHEITGHILALNTYNQRSHTIRVCVGTKVTTVVNDLMGTPTNTASGSLNCNVIGCTGVINVKESYTSSSTGSIDTDVITFIPRGN